MALNLKPLADRVVVEPMGEPVAPMPEMEEEAPTE